MRLVIIGLISIMAGACASIGRPEGGPKDEIPPEYVRSNPAPGTKNFTKNNIEIFFDENIKLDDASNKVVISPAQQQMPQISANGKKLTVLLRDSLLPDQTYTLDFSDAIRDLNEGNILDGFVLDFATGDSIDSLRISGLVLQAENLEPAQGIIVGAYRNLADSAISTLKVERICKTNQLGQFTLRNLKSEYYRLFAINDLNRDYHWDRSEDVAFYDTPVKPHAEDFLVTDTLRATNGSDSISSRMGVRFLPNDILLTWFNENYTTLYLKDHSRDNRNILRVVFSMPVDTLPILTITNGENEGKEIGKYSRLLHSEFNDTLDYWLEDSSIIMQDSLLIATRYLYTDTNEMLSWKTDTLRYFFRQSRNLEKELQKQAEEKERKEKKRQEAIKKWLETGDSALIADTIKEPEKIDFLTIKSLTNSTQDYHKPVKISFSEPVKEWDVSRTSLEYMEDSVWYKLPEVSIVQDSTGKINEYFITNPWEFETQYRLVIDSASVTSIYNKWNNNFKHEFKVKSPEDYSTLILEIPSESYFPAPRFNWDSLAVTLKGSVIADSLTAILTDNPLDSENIITYENGSDSVGIIFPDTINRIIETNDTVSINDSIDVNINNTSSLLPPIIVELLNSSEVVVERSKVVDGKAKFDFLTPGTYYARAFIDFNNNGKWDTGKLSEWRQPEDVYYYPKKIDIKQNWDMSQTWDIYELPVDEQKPLEIKKNKPKTKEATVNYDEEEEEDDGFGSNYFYQPGNAYGNGAANAQRTRNR